MHPTYAEGTLNRMLPPGVTRFIPVPIAQLAEQIRSIAAINGIVPPMMVNDEELPHNTTLTELEERYGIRTRISPPGEESRRAQFVRQYGNREDSPLNPYGIAISPDVQIASLHLYQTTIDAFRLLIQHPLIKKETGLDLEIKGVVGSFSNGHPRLGIVPPGVTYYQASSDQLTIHSSNWKTPLPSDIDILVGNIEEIASNPEIISKIVRITKPMCKLLFEEYGVFINVWAGQIINQTTANHLDSDGGLIKMYRR